MAIVTGTFDDAQVVADERWIEAIASVRRRGYTPACPHAIPRGTRYAVLANGTITTARVGAEWDVYALVVDGPFATGTLDMSQLDAAREWVVSGE
jgi:hypothetical protein